MSGVNKHILVGRLGKDPEVKSTDSGNTLVTFSLATSEVFKDKVTGEKKEITDWHNIVAWGATADIIAKYCKKGYNVYLEGRSKSRSWDIEGGKKGYITETHVDKVVLIQSTQSSVPPPSDPHESGFEKAPASAPDTTPF